ncbi:MAG: PaaI family thioesterase [Candidatus Korobacteraceae bacterium]|jgi:acyl-coenzyme A thioesterase PaaI-like protein
MSLAELQSVLDRAPFVQQYGFRLESAEAGTCTLYCPGNASFLRPDAIVSGPIFMAAADVAMWIAIISALGSDASSTVTVELKTNFVSALVGVQNFRCTGTVMKSGSRLVFGTADCRDLDGRLLTHHTMTYIRREKQ